MQHYRWQTSTMHRSVTHHDLIRKHNHIYRVNSQC